MAERVVLHVGPQKTGSTALQKAFAEGAGILAGAGIHYPLAGREGVAHQDVARACWTPDGSVLADLAREIADVRVAFLSSELFSPLDVTGLGRLADALGGATVEIVYMLRRPPLHLPSHWRELVKHGQAMDFADYLKVAEDRRPRPHIFVPLPSDQLARLAKVFGPEGLRLLVYDARRDDIAGYGPGFIDDVFGLGHLADRFETGRYNKTAPDWQVELGRHMNVIAGATLSYPVKTRLRSLMIRELGAAQPAWLDDFRAAQSAASAVSLSQDTPLVRAEVEAVLAAYGDYLMDPAESYSAPVSSEVRCIAPEALDAPLAGAVRAFYDDLVARLD